MLARRVLSSILLAFCAQLALMPWVTPAIAEQSSVFSWPEINLRIGGTVGFRPKYEGSKSLTVFGLPLIVPAPDRGSLVHRLRRRIHVEGPDHVQLKLFMTDSFEFGPVVGYRPDREASDGKLLGGLGTLDGGFVAGAFGRARWHFFYGDVAVARQLTGDNDGTEVRFGAGAEVPFGDRSLFGFRLGATYADDKYMDATFGITPAQSLTSTAGLPAFDPQAGLKDINVKVLARFQLTERFSVQPTFRYSRLLYDAERSPLVESVDQFQGTLRFTYRLKLP